MIAEKFGVDPDKVHKEEIDKGQFIIEYEGGTQGHLHRRARRGGLRPPVQLPPLQAQDPAPGRPCLRQLGCHRRQGREGNLRRGLQREGRKPPDDGAVKAGVLATEPANPKGIEIRGKVEGAMLKLGDKWREEGLRGTRRGQRAPEEDHDGDLPLHQVLLVHRGMPDLLLRGLHDQEPGARARPASSRPTSCST